MLKKSLKCPQCNKRFTNDNVEIFDLVDNECSLAVFCDVCPITIEVDVAAVENGKPMINVYPHDVVTEDDVEKVSKALSSHKGSLKKLLTQKGKPKK